MTEALDIDEIKTSLVNLNLSPRNVIYICNQEEFQSKQFRNGQLLYLYNHWEDAFGFKPTSSLLAAVFKIPESDVCRIIAQGKETPEKAGRNTLLSEEQANDLIQFILLQQEHGHPLPVSALLPHVEAEYGISHTRGWERYFVKKHADQIKIARSSPEEDNRLVVPRVFLDQYILAMRELSGKFCSELCFNLDEMGSSEYEDAKCLDVIVNATADPDEIEHPVSRAIHHQTLLATVTAAGDHLLPVLVTSTKIEDKMHLLGYRQGQDVCFVQRHVPYMDSRIFIGYLETILIPFIQEKRRDPKYANKFAILFLDSCSTHVTQNVKELLARHGVIMVCFPPHTTNLFQPLDLVLFGVIKHILSSLERSDEVNKQAGFAKKLLQAYERAMTSGNIRGAFERAGIVSDMTKDPSTIEFVEQKLHENPQFQAIYNANKTLDDISARRRNQPFGLINKDEINHFFPGTFTI